MKISLLNERIMIQKSEVSSDAIGNRISSWKDYCSCYATISSESPKEETAAGVTWDESMIDFTVRWCKETSIVNSKEYRVCFKDSIYNVEGIDHMNFKKKTIKLHCRRLTS
ncbi:MAG: phage head closure protein [Eubacterium sp.]|jgi:SPP1 family predicted phage head-tail adaptor|nr:phage head closure protein [Eubacterium sp.]MCH4078694.1 phage head closure protein [Eubacterium sp.]MCH4109835.1 phage head closure protein [Eubacterium sp.]MCI1307043.1 phage head closure protein [Eubacterium sp.]